MAPPSVANWSDDSPATWPAQEGLAVGRHRRADTDDPPEVRHGRRAEDSRPQDREDPRDREEPLGGREDPDLALAGGPAFLPSVEPPLEGPEDLLDERDAFVPPDPPMPRGDVISTLAWAGVVVGPLFLLFSVMFWNDAPDMLKLGAVGAFIGGFVTLISRLPRHRDEDDGDGAVV